MAILFISFSFSITSLDTYLIVYSIVCMEIVQMGKSFYLNNRIGGFTINVFYVYNSKQWAKSSTFILRDRHRGLAFYSDASYLSKFTEFGE